MLDERAKKAWRRHLHISVRVMLVLILAFGSALGWVIRKAKLQHAAVVDIRRVGGWIEYRRQAEISTDAAAIVNYPGHVDRHSLAERWIPQWVVDRIGIDYFDSPANAVLHKKMSAREIDIAMHALGYLNDLESLEIIHENLSDADLISIVEHRRLLHLRLSAPKVTAAGLAILEDLPELETLDLIGTPVNNEALSHMSSLTHFKSLELDRPRTIWIFLARLPASEPISDAGLVSLERLTNLLNLGLAGTNVSDAGLIHWKGMKQLERLNLDRTKIGDEGMSHLKELTHLEDLSIEETKVGDAGMVSLSNMPSLLDLKLANTKVGDVGLGPLEKLKNLRYLQTYDSRIGNQGIRRLRQILKQLRVNTLPPWSGRRP